MEDRIDRLDLDQIARMGASCTLGYLRMATRLVTQIYDDILQPSGLRATQFSLLAGVALMGPATMSLLAEKGVMDRTTLTRNLKPLEDQGLIKVVPGEDRRTRQVAITRRGEDVVAYAIPLWEEAQAYMAKGLGDKPTRDLLGNLLALLTTVRRP